MKKKPNLSWLAIVALGYHLFALAKDAERCAYNARRVRDDPSLANLGKLLVAEGVLISDL